MKRFFILWNPESEKPPTIRFITRREAERMAASCSQKWNTTVYVCEAQVSFVPIRVVREELE